jgi:hypothetical protein
VEGGNGAGARASGVRGGGPVKPEPVLRRHKDHDPSLICRPAFGNGLCEVLPDGVDVRPWREVLNGQKRSEKGSGDVRRDS